MTVELRRFPAVSVEAIVELWNQALPRDPITIRRFTNLFLLDPNFDPTGLQLAIDGDRLVGVMYGVRRLVPLHGGDLEPDQGWIGFFFVHPEFRRLGIGSRLMHQTLRWLDRPIVSFSPTTPNYFLPGLDATEYPAAEEFLTEHGFSLQYEAVAMDRSLHDYRVPGQARDAIRSLEGRGYRFGSPGVDDLVELISLARDHFNPDWGRAIREAVAAGLPLDRIVLARGPAGTLVGWAMHGTYEGVIERFGPFGVRSECRGTGLGRALLYLTLERMRAQGAHSAWFLWTAENSPAGFLYRKAGFATTRTFRIMRKSA
ncbi:MAG TPA: GNAT family N-acetyltransferase [Mycobacteriales bacterium]|nr:GNAT family N-acetyltransferase [Mycobacteriales bacterium]